MTAGDFGRLIKAKRERLSLTQVEAAKRSGVTANTVARWERGEVTPSPFVQKAALQLLK